MELKNYQKTVMQDLTRFIAAVNREGNIVKGWESYWQDKDINVGANGALSYKNKIKNTPCVCLKVPTGGGKTFMACCAVKKIFAAMPPQKPKLLVWLVPSDPILQQTLRTLSDAGHPYRRRLDRDFGGRVGIYTKDMLLGGQNFSPDTVRELLTICVLSYDSLRINRRNRDIRKVYQENGNLLRFADMLADKVAFLDETPDTALIQVLRCLSPVIIIDESHNAGSDLSAEMLDNLNPSFVLELTATPRDSSNIISYVDARELKKENMVKLPVVVFNRSSKQAVIQDAIQLRGSLELQAKAERSAGGAYIRPIVLFQAQPKTSEESETFDKIKKMLIDIGIAPEEIAVKTSQTDDLKGVDLLSADCKIRYIITVNALKEGWDCPFAYILASLANKTSRVDVEQILGRILRQPYAKKHTAQLLNTSYVLTSSNDFHATLESIVAGLNKSGFSGKDYRVAQEGAKQEAEAVQPTFLQQTLLQAEDAAQQADDFSDVDVTQIKEHIARVSAIDNDFTNTGAESSGAGDSALTAMLDVAAARAEQYDSEVDKVADDELIRGDLADMVKQYKVQAQYREEIKALKIPQFFIASTPGVFSDACYELLEPENLSEDFSLAGQDAQISFELATGEMYSVDIQEQGEAVPKYKRSSQADNEYFRRYLESLPPEGKIRQCAAMIAKQINKNDRYATSDVEKYVRRVIDGMTEDALNAMSSAVPVYAKKIQDKIEKLEKDYRRKRFNKLLDSGTIICDCYYEMPAVITPASATASVACSLYEAEKDDMNNFERRVIDVIVGTDNIRWWHRVIERKDFYINGYIKHYPDFMVMTKSGKLVLVEAKGDYLDGDNSKAKLELGRKWQRHAGSDYCYFMVFENKDLEMDGAYTLDEFVDVIKVL